MSIKTIIEIIMRVSKLSYEETLIESNIFSSTKYKDVSELKNEREKGIWGYSDIYIEHKCIWSYKRIKL